MRTGLVSISFRKLDPASIIELCAKAQLGQIEWGGDVHVPPCDIDRAVRTAEMSLSHGIRPVGYGSYYNASDSIDAFMPNLEAACALGAKYVRIWAGKSSSFDANAAENIRLAVKAGAERGIKVSLECHRGTMTEDRFLAVKIAEATGCLLHYQPNPDISFEENLEALRISRPHLCACHVFAWDKGNVRLPLREHRAQWIEYVREAGDVPLLLEFVEGDSEDNLLRDAEELKCIISMSGV